RVDTRVPGQGRSVRGAPLLGSGGVSDMYVPGHVDRDRPEPIGALAAELPTPRENVSRPLSRVKANWERRDVQIRAHTECVAPQGSLGVTNYDDGIVSGD